MKEVLYKFGQPNRTTVSREDYRIEHPVDILNSLSEVLGTVLGNGNGKDKKSIRSKRIGAFAIANADVEELEVIIEFAKANNLSVSGDYSRRVERPYGSLGYFRKGDIITLGTSDRFDVSYVESTRDLLKDVPVLDMRFEMSKISDALVEFAAEKRGLEKEFATTNRNFRELKLMKLDKSSTNDCGCTLPVEDNAVIVTDQYVKFYNEEDGYTFVPFNRELDDLAAIIREFAL